MNSDDKNNDNNAVDEEISNATGKIFEKLLYNIKYFRTSC